MRVGVSWVRDEADIIELTVRHQAAFLDELLIADHGSTDGTRELLDELARQLPLTVFDDTSGVFRQADAMNELVRMIPEADWIVPFDGDECWEPPEQLPDVEAVSISVYDHVAVDGVPGLPWRRDRPSSSKVMFRPGFDRELVMGNHAVRGIKTMPNLGGMIHHFPNRSPEQLERKIRRGAATYGGSGYGAHWRRMLADVEEFGIERTWRVFAAADPAGLVYDPVQPQSRV